MFGAKGENAPRSQQGKNEMKQKIILIVALCTLLFLAVGCPTSGGGPGAPGGPQQFTGIELGTCSGTSIVKCPTKVDACLDVSTMACDKGCCTAKLIQGNQCFTGATAPCTNSQGHPSTATCVNCNWSCQ
jgi:hypothetical protein